MPEVQDKLRFLESILGKSIFSKNSGEAVFNCPFCNHHKKKFSINLNSDKYHCWVCSKAGRSLFHLIRQQANEQRAKEYNKKFGKTTFSKKEDFVKIELPEGYIPLINCKNTTIGKSAWNYVVKKRGIKPIDVLRYKIGACLDDRNYGGITFPSFDKTGNLNYYIIRNLRSHIKYFGAIVPKDYKNSIIINEVNIDWTKPIILTEGYIDAIKTGEENVIPLCGSYFSKSTKLFEEITKNKPKVYIALDKDAKKKAMKIANNLVKNDIETMYVDIGEYDDIGDMEYGAFTKYLNEAIVVDEEFLFRQKMMEAFR